MGILYQIVLVVLLNMVSYSGEKKEKQKAKTCLDYYKQLLNYLLQIKIYIQTILLTLLPSQNAYIFLLLHVYSLLLFIHL